MSKTPVSILINNCRIPFYLKFAIYVARFGISYGGFTSSPPQHIKERIVEVDISFFLSLPFSKFPTSKPLKLPSLPINALSTFESKQPKFMSPPQVLRCNCKYIENEGIPFGCYLPSLSVSGLQFESRY